MASLIGGSDAFTSFTGAASVVSHVTSWNTNQGAVQQTPVVVVAHPTDSQQDVALDTDLLATFAKTSYVDSQDAVNSTNLGNLGMAFAPVAEAVAGISRPSHVRLMMGTTQHKGELILFSPVDGNYTHPDATPHDILASLVELQTKTAQITREGQYLNIDQNTTLRVHGLLECGNIQFRKFNDTTTWTRLSDYLHIEQQRLRHVTTTASGTQFAGDTRVGAFFAGGCVVDDLRIHKADPLLRLHTSSLFTQPTPDAAVHSDGWQGTMEGVRRQGCMIKGGNDHFDFGSIDFIDMRGSDQGGFLGGIRFSTGEHTYNHQGGGVERMALQHNALTLAAGVDLKSTGEVSCASVSSTGAVSCASVSSSGAVTGNDVTISSPTAGRASSLRDCFSAAQTTQYVLTELQGHTNITLNGDYGGTLRDMINAGVLQVSNIANSALAKAQELVNDTLVTVTNGTVTGGKIATFSIETPPKTEKSPAPLCYLDKQGKLTSNHLFNSKFTDQCFGVADDAKSSPYLQGLVPTSDGSARKYLRADGTWSTLSKLWVASPSDPNFPTEFDTSTLWDTVTGGVAEKLDDLEQLMANDYVSKVAFDAVHGEVIDNKSLILLLMYNPHIIEGGFIAAHKHLFTGGSFKVKQSPAPLCYVDENGGLNSAGLYESAYAEQVFGVSDAAKTSPYLPGLVPTSTGSATQFLRSDGLWCEVNMQKVGNLNVSVSGSTYTALQVGDNDTADCIRLAPNQMDFLCGDYRHDAPTGAQMNFRVGSSLFFQMSFDAHQTHFIEQVLFEVAPKWKQGSATVSMQSMHDDVATVMAGDQPKIGNLTVFKGGTDYTFLYGGPYNTADAIRLGPGMMQFYAGRGGVDGASMDFNVGGSMFMQLSQSAQRLDIIKPAIFHGGISWKPGGGAEESLQVMHDDVQALKNATTDLSNYYDIAAVDNLISQFDTSAEIDAKISAISVAPDVKLSDISRNIYGGTNVMWSLQTLGYIAMPEAHFYGNVFWKPNGGSLYNLNNVYNDVETLKAQPDVAAFTAANRICITSMVNGGTIASAPASTDLLTLEGGNRWFTDARCDARINTRLSTVLPALQATTMTAQTVTALSDENLKKDIVRIDPHWATAAIKEIFPASYAFKSDPNKQRFGVIAQQVRQHIPSLVHETVDHSLSVEYQGLIPLLLSSLQDAHKRIAALENVVAHIPLCFE